MSLDEVDVEEERAEGEGRECTYDDERGLGR